MELIKLLLLLNYNSNITIEQNFQHENNLFSKLIIILKSYDMKYNLKFGADIDFKLSF